MAGYSSFLGWIVFHSIYVSHIFFHSFINGHLDYFNVLAIVNNAVVKMGEQISFLRQWFCFLWINTQKWNCWIIWCSIFRVFFLRNLHTAFHSRCNQFSFPSTVHDDFFFSTSLLLPVSFSLWYCEIFFSRFEGLFGEVRPGYIWGAKGNVSFWIECVHGTM